ncbi:MAG: RNA methyltransferase [Bacteroidota bacterium]
MRELCGQAPSLIDELFALPDWLAQNTLPPALKDRAEPINAKELSQISKLRTPNQVLAIANAPNLTFPAPAAVGPMSLYLDGIQDPGNMGTILRIADWYGLDHLFCAPDTVEVFNAKVIQASMGAVFRIQVHYLEVQQLRAALPDFTFYGMLMEGNSIFTTTWKQPAMLVIGNEGQGIRQATFEALDAQITIPKGKNGRAESLNAAIATGIVCAVFEEKTL